VSTVNAYDELLVADPVGFWTRQRRVGVSLAVAGAVAAVLFGMLAGAEDARFTFTERPSGPSVAIGGRTGAVLFAVIALLAGAAMLAPTARKWFTSLLGVGIVGVVLSFLCWQISSAPAGLNFMPLVDIVRGTFIGALPLIFGALAGVLCERSGVVNVAIEGQLLAGAFGGALVGSIAASAWIGLIGGVLGGVLISGLLAWFSIRYLVDQVVLGVVLNLLAIGLTGFVYAQVMQHDPEKYNQPPAVPVWHIPLLDKIPVLGPAVFTGNLFLFLGLILVAVINVALFRTRWGLRTRSVGEHPAAADTVGINVLRVRYRNVLLAGVVAGLGGAFFTLGLVGQFSKNMINGKGFIALAALIFGRWNPVGALLAALFFGFADKLSGYLGGIGSPIPSEFLAMLPYLATILAVAGLVGRVRAPAADGTPYVKG
jgi:general nucleoside transport system permease protein